MLFCLHFEMGNYHLIIANMIFLLHSYEKWPLEAENNMQPRLSLHKQERLHNFLGFYEKLSFIEVNSNTFFFKSAPMVSTESL